jgi:ABC-type bacteriocin/lantibiotic exporter with double-glycine peptidase domain
MRLVTIGRAIYGMLLPDERQRLRVLGLLSLAAAVLEAVGAVLVFVLLARFTSGGDETLADRLMAGYDPSDVTIVLSGLVLLYALLRMTFSVAENHLQSRRVQQFAASLSARVLEHYSRRPLAMHNTHRSGDFLRDTWFASEMLIRQSLLGLLSVCTEAAVMIGLLAVLFMVSPVAATGVVMFGGVLVFVGYRLFGRYITGWGESAEDHASACLQQVQEFFGGFREIKLANAESHLVERYRFERGRLARSYWRYQTMSQAPRLLIEGLLAASIGVVVLVFTLTGSEQEGVTTMALLGYAGFRVLPSANRILAAIGNVAYGSSALDLINTVFDSPTEVVRADRRALEFNDVIRVSDVMVTFPGVAQPAIDGISFEIAKGEHIGLVGSSGEGKTTVLNVVAGLILPDHGSVFVDGCNIGDSLFQWRAKIGLVAQTAFMLDSSVRVNVAFGVAEESIDDERVWWALERARIAEHVSALPDRLSTTIGDRGARLSGGQTQRVAIARALYKESEVLILDEPTAALDRETEVELAESLAEISDAYTTLVVSHRLAILRHCDRIHSIKKGRMETVGTLKDLQHIADRLDDVSAEN